jgi:MFS family permease
MGLTQAVFAVLGAKTARTFGYGFLGILFPVYLADLGVSASGIGVAVTLTLVASSVLTWGVRRPAERWGGRRVLLALTALTALAALLLLVSRDPRLVVLAAMIGNVAVGTGETGPFLTLEQVLIARAAPASRRTGVLRSRSPSRPPPPSRSRFSSCVSCSRRWTCRPRRRG